MRIIAGEARSRRIDAPPGRDTRPTLDRVRENLFNMLQYDVPGSRVLDLYAGSGALSLEAVSRGADYAVLVDHDYQAVKTQKKNIQALGYEKKTYVYHCDWEVAVRELEKKHEKFSLVFLDPPYEMTDLTVVFNKLMVLITENSQIIVEHEAKKDIIVNPCYLMTKKRCWGYCGVSFYCLKPDA